MQTLPFLEHNAELARATGGNLERKTGLIFG